MSLILYIKETQMLNENTSYGWRSAILAGFYSFYNGMSGYYDV